VKPLLAATATEAPDEQLVAAARDGSDEAFEALFRRYRDCVVGYVRGMVSDHGRAEDIVQEAFMSALRALRRSDQEIVFRPWIYEIAKNACIDHLRRARRSQEISIDSEDFSPVEEHRISQAASGTDATVARRNELESLRMAFHDLPPTQHEILVMRELEGLSYDLIGDRMGLTRGAVESLLFRARRSLRVGFDEIDTGARCQTVRSSMEGFVDGSVRARDRRRLTNHLNHCKACRRHAIAMGLDSLVLDSEQSRARRAVHRAAGFLPLPAFLRRRLEDSGWLGPAAQAGMEQGATFATKATAVVIAAAVAAGGAGVAHKASGGKLPGPDLPLVGKVGGAGGTGDSGAGGAGGLGGGAGGSQGAGGGLPGSGGGMAGGSGPAGPNGPAGDSGLPGGLGGGPLDTATGLGTAGGRTTGEAGRLTEALPGLGGVGRTLDSAGGAVGLTPTKTAKDLANGNVREVTRDAGRTIENAPKTVEKIVKNPGGTVKEVTKTLPRPKVTVPKEVQLPAGGSIKTGDSGTTGPSVTPPRTNLPVPALPQVQLPPLPANGLTSGLGL
jgi:RNA polymerase sigma factor (sigma-70 family)